MSARSDIAEALNTVAGIRASEYFTASTNKGTAYPQLDRVEYPNSFGGIVVWNVYVLCPQDWAQAEKFVEEYLPLLEAALTPHLAISSAQMSRLQIPSIGEIPALIFTGRREAD